MAHARSFGRLPARLLGALLAPLAAGWLASGSCYVSGCYEECDPCVQQCKCKTVCEHALAAEGAYRIAGCTSRVLADGEDRVRRVLGEVIGPALELALGPGPHDAGALARFARGVLDVNHDLVPLAAGAHWELVAVEGFDAATVVTFEAGPRAGRSAFQSNGVSLLFDRRGRLVEVDQVLARGSP